MPDSISSQFHLVAAIPFFLALILGEHWASRSDARPSYESLYDTLSNLGCGIARVLLDVFLSIPFIVGYAWLQAKLGIAPIAPSLVGSIALFVLIDLIYYFFHRASHEVPLLWAFHSVHHQSDAYNYSVGIRQPILNTIVAFPILLPPLLLGFPIAMYVVPASLHAIVQIWTHTRRMDADWPVFRAIFVTPKHHRVHHGANAPYVNRNYSGVFSVWDYAFGTFVREETEPVYGVAEKVPGLDPIRANLAPLAALAREVKAARGVRAKFRALFLPGPIPLRDRPRPAPRERNRPRSAAVFTAYLLVFSAAVLNIHLFGWGGAALVVAVLFLGMAALGRAWARSAEAAVETEG